MEVLLSKEYVYSLLEEKKMAKADFARMIGIQRTNLDALLDSKKKDINVVIKMAEVLGMSLQEFIGFAPSDFRIRGFVKVGEQLREIKTEEDWYKAENDSGVCSIPYYSGFNEACDEIGKFLKKEFDNDGESAIMGRINGEVVFALTILDSYDTNPDTAITEKEGREIILTTISSERGTSVMRFNSVEYVGERQYMIESIKAEIMGFFENKME